jgi:hypothetical protein
MVETVARNAGLHMERPDHVQSMYAEWRRTQRVRDYAARKYKLEQYYDNLVDLAVISHIVGDTVLSYSVFRKWQDTNYIYQKHIPSLNAAVKAFKYLPSKSGLCQWIVVFYSYLWTTSSVKNYNEMWDELRRPDAHALGAFLFGIALERCAHTVGRDVAVLRAWCKFHDHASVKEESECKAERDGILRKTNKCTLDEMAAQQADEKLEDAVELVQERGGTVTFGKRKAEGPPAGTPKGFKKSRKIIGDIGS